MLVSKGKFLQYQSVFHNKVINTPHTIELEIVTAEKPTDTGEFNMDAFVGDMSRTSKFYKFNALYEKDIPEWNREKWGIPLEVNGVVYLSPKQLVPKLGTFRLKRNQTKIHFGGSVQIIHKIMYLEEMYDSCVGIQIFVKDDLKGG